MERSPTATRPGGGGRRKPDPVAGRGRAPTGAQVKGGASVHAELHPGVAVLVLPHPRTGLLVLDRMRSGRTRRRGGLLGRSGAGRGGAGGQGRCNGCTELQRGCSVGSGGPGVYLGAPSGRAAGGSAADTRVRNTERERPQAERRRCTKDADPQTARAGTGRSESYPREGSGPGRQAAWRPSGTAAPL